MTTRHFGNALRWPTTAMVSASILRSRVSAVGATAPTLAAIGSISSSRPRAGISTEDHGELEERAAEARRGAPGIAWDEIKRDLLK